MGENKDKIEYVKDRLGHDLRYAIDFTKAKEELNWEPLIDFKSGLEETIKWYKDNIAWWQKLKK